MKSDVETLSPTRVKLTVELPFEELQDSIDAAYQRIASQVTVPGFRKGKVPQRVIDQRVGRGAVLEEVVNAAVPEAYEKAVIEHKVYVVGRPELDVTEIADGEHIAFTAEVDVRPEFELPEYKGLAVVVDDAEVTEEQVDEEVDQLRRMFGSLTTVERAAADGDVLLVDIAGSKDGEPVEDLQASALSYELGTDGLLPGFDEAVRGASAGETRTFTFAPDAGELVGQEFEVAATVTAVRERVLPDADDDFAALASEFDTLEELRADQRTRLERQAVLLQGAEARNKLHDALMDSIDIPLPEGVIAAEVDDHFSHGHDGHEDTPEHRTEVEDGARKALKSQFVLDRIADDADVSVSEAELSAWLVQQAPRYGMPPQQFADLLVQNGQVGMAVADVRRGKALQAVLEAAVITDASGRTVDLSVLDDRLAPLDDVLAVEEALEADDEDAED